MEKARVIISKKGEKWQKERHPWVYESDVLYVEGDHENGDIVDVYTEKGKYVGTGFLSLLSKIRVRIFHRDRSTVYDKDFWKRRISYAWNYRKTALSGDIDSCRMVYGESDQLPGLTVDKYNDVLVTQIVCIGMERMKEILFPLLIEVLEEDGISVRGIYERNDVSIRKLEGLTEYKGWYFGGGETETLIRENGIAFKVDIENGQKTGYFLDQRRNRKLVMDIAKGKRVLDCFTHTGSFACHAAKFGAKSVTAVDISETAIAKAKENAELNGLSIDFEVADVFDYLETAKKKDYDLIILDPPAFTKNRKTVNNAYRGYLEINVKAMKLLGRGGYLATCSCSHFMPHEKFEEMLREAAMVTGYDLKILSVTQQNADHPVMLHIPETDYLKFFILQVV